MKKHSLKKRSLKEQQEQYPQQISDFAPVPQKPVSLDQIIDRYVVRYERESIPLEGERISPQAPVMEESMDVESLVMFLLEQAPPPPGEEEPPAEEPAPDALPDAPTDTPPAEPAPTGDSPPVLNTPKLNVANFCRSIARLINNFDALLNPKNIIFNRVEAYIKANYDERTAKYFRQVMERNYSIRSTSVEYPEDADDLGEPYAIQPGSAGGSPGGGGG